MREYILIPLTQGKFAIIDAQDFDIVSKYKWRAWKERNYFYAVTNVKIGDGKTRVIKMHRLILSLKMGDKRIIDHINRTGTDNRRENLKITDTRGNQRNRRDQSRYGYCIYLDKRSKKYQVLVKVNENKIHVGIFDTKESAIEARDKFLNTV